MSGIRLRRLGCGQGVYCLQGVVSSGSPRDLLRFFIPRDTSQGGVVFAPWRGGGARIKGYSVNKDKNTLVVAVEAGSRLYRFVCTEYAGYFACYPYARIIRVIEKKRSTSGGGREAAPRPLGEKREEKEESLEEAVKKTEIDLATLLDEKAIEEYEKQLLIGGEEEEKEEGRREKR